jgi:hypothetical protein
VDDHGYEIISANPDASDLFDDRFPAVQAGNTAFEALLVELLEPATRSSGLGLSANDLARMITSAMQGFKRRAASKAELDDLLDTCLRVTLGARRLRMGNESARTIRPGPRVRRHA